MRILGPLAVILASACSGTATTEPQACAPGRQIACDCPASSEKGVQTCAKNGSGYTPCTGCSGSSGSGGGPGVGLSECDPLAQTGCPKGEKCTDRYDGTNFNFFCAPDGNVAPGGDCVLDFLGHDNCARGSLCTVAGLGDADPSAAVRHFVCRAYCASDGDCAAAEPGSSMCDRLTRSPTVGFCLPACTPFGTDCGPTGTCAGRRVDTDGFTEFVVCHFAGPNAAASTCTTDGECGTNMLCETVQQSPSTAVCRQLCDPNHDCPPGTSCTTSGSSQIGECK